MGIFRLSAAVSMLSFCSSCMTFTNWFKYALISLNICVKSFEFHHTIAYFKYSSKESYIYFCLENPMDGGAWQAAVHGVAKSRTRLSDFTFTFLFSLSCTGEGNGNPLQCSCLENPRDGKPGGLPSMGRTESDTTEATQQQQQQQHDEL